MRDIFQDLYNKVLGFFNSQQDTPDPTKGVAMNRLKTVLMQDRVGFSERAIQMMKEELVHVVSKYMEIDDENFQLQIDAEHDKTILELSIPVVRPKSDEEIDESLQEQAIKTQKKAESIVKELESLIKERALALVEGEIDPELIKEAAKKAEETEEDITEADGAEIQEETVEDSQEKTDNDTASENTETVDNGKEVHTCTNQKHSKKKARKS